jgi:hypothetical protein
VKDSEKTYIRKHWCTRESQFIYNFTKKDPNLGYNSIQRVESTHPVTITLLNYQLSLTKASLRLAKEIRMLLKDLDEEESKSYGSTPRTLDLRAFSAVISQVAE